MRMLTVLLLLLTIRAEAQLNPLNSLYYFNRYEGNPAFAGISQEVELNASMKAQWTAVPGAPMMQGFTASKGFGNRMATGIVVYNETAGLLGRTNFKASYAYHIPLDYEEGNSLDLGLNVGVAWERASTKKAMGDLEDPFLYAYNERPAQLDGDFGAALRYEGWTVQAILPNLRAWTKHQNSNTVADRYAAMAAVSYRFPTSYQEETMLEPLVMYRYVQGFRSMLDVGMQATFEQERLHANIIYHNTGSLTVGVGTTYQNVLGISASYTSDTGAMRHISNGEFGIAIKYIARARKR